MSEGLIGAAVGMGLFALAVGTALKPPLGLSVSSRGGQSRHGPLPAYACVQRDTKGMG
jgi:hypothetical protein